MGRRVNLAPEDLRAGDRVFITAYAEPDVVLTVRRNDHPAGYAAPSVTVRYRQPDGQVETCTFEQQSVTFEAPVGMLTG